MRPESMPKSFALKYSNGPSRVEILKEILNEYPTPNFNLERAALIAAINALEAIENAVAVYQFECDGSWVDCTKEHFEGHDGSEKRILYTHPPKPVVTEQCPACNRAWTEHRMGYSASQCKAKPPKPVVSDERVDVAFKAFHSFVPTNGGTTGFKQQLKAALEVALGVKS